MKISDTPTDSFCNWTMYKICDLIEKEQLHSKLVFMHVAIGAIDAVLARWSLYESAIRAQSEEA